VIYPSLSGSKSKNLVITFIAGEGRRSVHRFIEYLEDGFVYESMKHTEMSSLLRLNYTQFKNPVETLTLHITKKDKTKDLAKAEGVYSQLPSGSPPHKQKKKRGIKKLGKGRSASPGTQHKDPAPTNYANLPMNPKHNFDISIHRTPAAQRSKTDFGAKKPSPEILEANVRNIAVFFVFTHFSV